MSLPLARLLQLADSACPTGAYAFSDGLETLAARGEVRDAQTLSAFLAGQLACGWGTLDAPACALAWSGDGVAEVDSLLDLLRPVAGPREASLRVGANLWRVAGTLWPQRLAGRSPARHHATAFGVIAAVLGVSQADTVTALGTSWLLGRALSATRLMRLGGLDAQRVVAGLEPALARAVALALSATPADLHTFTPHLDVAASEQAGLPVRLFQS